MPTPPYRVFFSAPLDGNLTPDQLDIKRGILDAVHRQGYEPQAIGELGFAANMSWTFDDPSTVMQLCQGAIILGLARWTFDAGPAGHQVGVITEWSHYEGAVAIVKQRPVLIISEAGVLPRGIMYTGGGKYVLQMPPGADAAWLQTPAFQNRFKLWCDEVNARRHVFFGYSGGAKSTAQAIIEFLRAQDVMVMDWATDFKSGGTILDQIKFAERQCLGGLFLFTKDDELISGDEAKAAPRDNVIFEAGYFMNTKGGERVLIIREEGAKMPADVGGMIYLPLNDRSDISTIQDDLLKFIRDRF